MQASEIIKDGWLVLEYPSNPVIRLDGRILDRVLAEDSELILSVDDTTGIVGLMGGAVRAVELASELTPYTRSAPIRDLDGYEHAMRRLEALRASPRAIDTRPALYLGTKPITVSDEVLYFEDEAYALSDLEPYAIAGHSIPLGEGHIRAALVSLLLAARLRREDIDRLAERIKAYEARVRV
jgi:hypothetical protein